ncbi:endonuclease MutS2 [Sporolactobacillus laevolacticus]|uniref:Endonuclease MutS2 n=1 Tax=Sporolactobacillus laevolacticus DSM 442 TaxID=1395513 RepID=V6J128_9BACL|nr:endonuclease MutS2 [Sporolactobacillus laevolacticus]EST13515.1 DNA mismatch repair protein MutS [Sporolactobacillus laevolacticus DSM 442]
MNEHALRILEFEKIKQQLMHYTASSLGKSRIEALFPSGNLDEVKKWQEETDEGATVLRLKGSVPFGGITDVRPALKRSKIGGILQAKELIDIADTIRGSRLMKNFISDLVEDRELDLPILMELVMTIDPPGALERNIRSAIDDQGGVMDSASPALRHIRGQIRTCDSRVKQKLESIVRSSGTAKMLSEAIITIRNDRQVIPVKQEYRGSFGGIVHDQSASGATLFIEPQAIVDLNNQLSEARAKERHEIERILRVLSEETAEYAEAMLENVEALAQLDFVFAKAAYGHQMKATRPKLNDQGIIRLKKARHPLIDRERVVPIDVVFDEHTHALIITGPNTGGKTVSLKTIGLLTLMAQSGLQLPVDEDSEASIFRHVFADIGDEQSIEQSLSTFSSHMTNIVEILKEVDFSSLVLFDELGAGTDPQEGAALSMSILDAVYGKGATIVCTTHYSELKAYAYERPGVMNASVEFDVETLSPTYRLLLGVPGRSNAFEISRKLGLPVDIIDGARLQISRETNQVDKMIASLEKNRKAAEEEEEKARKLKLEVEAKEAALTKKLNELERSKDDILKKAREKAERALKDARQEAEEIIEDLRHYKKNGQVKEHQLIDAKTKLAHALDSLEQNNSTASQQPVQKAASGFQPGDAVKIISFGQDGYIVNKISDQEYLVQAGILKMNVKAGDLKRVKEKKKVKPVVNVRTSGQTVRPELDLRGERYEDAMLKVEKYLDEAMLAGYPRVSIIHGKGTGALRKGVTQLIDRHPRVKASRLGAQGEGGSGVTVVEFK